MKISVIVPVYNTAQFLPRCIESILSQSFTDFELLLIDDGSTDGSGDNARGEWVTFVDSDDYVSPVILEKCLESVNGYDMVVFNYQNVEGDREALGEPIGFCAGSIRWNNEEEKARYLDETFFHYSWSACIRLFRSDVIEQNNLRFTDHLNYAEDMFFCYVYELHCNSLMCIDDVLYYYTQRSGSIMGTQGRENLKNLNRLNEHSKAINKHLFSQDGFSALKKHFPLVHRKIIDYAFDLIQIDTGPMGVFRKREAILANVLDIDYFNNEARGIINSKKELKNRFGLVDGFRIYRDWRYYLNGNKFHYQLSRVIIRLCKLLGAE